jgi:hypothetical protein
MPPDYFFTHLKYLLELYWRFAMVNYLSTQLQYANNHRLQAVSVVEVENMEVLYQRTLSIIWIDGVIQRHYKATESGNGFACATFEIGGLE